MNTTFKKLAVATQLAIAGDALALSKDAFEDLPSMVHVSTFKTVTRGDKAQKVRGSESLGFIIESDGFMLTTYRSLLDRRNGDLLTEISITIPGDNASPYTAKIVAVEPTLNFAILKIESDKPFETSSIISRDEVKTGLDLYAFKDVYSPSNPIVEGKILSLNRMECYQENMTGTMIKSDLSLSLNSMGGGPIFNKEGEIVSIYTGYEPHTEEGSQRLEEEPGEYLLPISLVFNIYESVKERGSFISPWTGFAVRPTTQSEKSIFPFQKFNGGIGIDYIWENSPAEKLGIQEGDILVRFGHYPIQSEADFQKWLYRYGVGQSTQLHLIRNGTDYLILDYLIEERPKWATPR